MLGEDDETIKAGIKSAAEKLGKPETTLTNLLDKVKYIAEKIQKNTSTMIPDQQFLSQEQVATTVLALADDEQAKILNGKIIPGDRVFYPVKPHVASSIPKIEKNNLDGKQFTMLVDDEWYGRKAKNRPELESLESMIKEKGGLQEPGDKDLFIISTGDYDFTIDQRTGTPNLTHKNRFEWNDLIDQFIFNPAEQTQDALNTFVPGGSNDPRKFKDAKGRIVIIGPNLPRHKHPDPKDKQFIKLARAKVEVFRGALRPFVTTVNQELSDVLKSNIRVFLILPGSIDGKEPNNENIVNTINYLMSDEAASSSEVIFCPDETR